VGGWQAAGGGWRGVVRRVGTQVAWGTAVSPRRVPTNRAALWEKKPRGDTSRPQKKNGAEHTYASMKSMHRRVTKEISTLKGKPLRTRDKQPETKHQTTTRDAPTGGRPRCCTTTPAGTHLLRGRKKK